MSLWSRIERRLGDLAGDLLADEHRSQLAAARELIELDDPAGAVELLESVIAARPADSGALCLLGAAHLAQQHNDEAAAAFETALAIHDDLPEAHIGLGQALLARGQHPEALASFRAAIHHAGGDTQVLAVAYRGRGRAYRAAGETDKAIRELRKAVTEAPEDAEALALLGATLVDERPQSDDQARTYLTRALRGDDPPALARLALARLQLRGGEVAEAVASFEAALASEDVELQAAALIGLGDAAAAAGDQRQAHDRYLRALALHPRRADLHARLADAQRAVGSLDAALASYERAVDLGDDNALAPGLDVAIECGAVDRAVFLANKRLAVDPNDSRALTARGIQLATHGQLDAARATYDAALAARDDPEAHIAAGRLELTGDVTDPAALARAVEHAWAALRVDPRSPRARGLLADARHVELATPTTTGDPDDSAMYLLALDVQRVALSRPELADLVAEAAHAATDFDQPLLVTVMGEFSSGKSTFVNAFVREQIAPVGIRPTTATINVLKYGRERGGRVLYRDGRIETLSWTALSALLTSLDHEGARAVSTVEILYPLDELERVNIVDTPGLNSILPEHEQVARDFIGRADAVVWVFAAGQAGKATEREALESIRDEGKRVLGVLNKVDQLSEAEVTQVTEHVERELGDLVEVVVPLSARQALASPDDGNWPQLHAALEARFFRRARELKREACDRRLSALIARGRARIQDQRAAATAAAASLADASAAAHRHARRFAGDVVTAELHALSERMGGLYRAAAREVLDLVRPRRLPFGSHSATRADRDYLLALLEAGFDDIMDPTRSRVGQELRAAGHAAAAALARETSVVGAEAVRDIETVAHDGVLLVEARVFARAIAFVRGYLRGGVVDSFFRDAVPKLDLVTDAVYHALYRDSPDLEREVGAPLARAGADAIVAIAARLHQASGIADAIAYDLEVGSERALETIDRRRRSLHQ